MKKTKMDVIVVGASGFTGKRICHLLARMNLKWAIGIRV
jgi:short subunit dehydrogenase-like uncharacterized protein